MSSSELEAREKSTSPAKPDVAIRVTGLSKRYRIYRKPSHKLAEALWNTLLPMQKKLSRDFWALTNVDLEVQRGTTLGIIGRNGSGKSTLLQIIAGVLQATKGNVEVNGRVSALLELGAGFNREFTGRENVFLQGAVMGIPRVEMQRRLPEIEAFADIGDFIDQPVKTYSSGMYVRLAFAVAINVDADILIIDEALAVGDDMFRRRCYSRLEELQREGKTLLFVSHSLGTVGALCDRAMLLNDGLVVTIGGPADAIKQYYRLTAEIERARLTGAELRQAKMIKGVGKSDEAEYSVSEVRTGSGEAEIADVALLDSKDVPVQVLQTGETCCVQFVITFRKDVAQPIVWFSIKTLTGLSLITANNNSLGKTFQSVLAGQRIRVSFRQSMSLNRGAYAITVRVGELSDTGEEIFLDSRWDVLTFRVVQSNEAYGLFANEVDLVLSEV